MIYDNYLNDLNYYNSKLNEKEFNREMIDLITKMCENLQLLNEENVTLRNKLDDLYSEVKWKQT